MSCDALYSVDADATGVNGISALDMVLAQQKVQVQFEQTQGEKNRVAVTGGAVYSGYAWVNDISINAANRQNTSYTIQMTGDGQLAKSTVAEVCQTKTTQASLAHYLSFSHSSAGGVFLELSNRRNHGKEDHNQR